MKKIVTLATIVLGLYIHPACANFKVIDIATPDGFERTEAIENSYADYLRNLYTKEKM